MAKVIYSTPGKWWWRFTPRNLVDRLYCSLVDAMPRRMMYFAINRVMVEGREVYGDEWNFTLHRLQNVRSEYGGMGNFGRRIRPADSRSSG